MATYSPKVPIGSLISFNQKTCGVEPVIISNAQYCSENVVSNYNFQNDWSNEWTVNVGTKTGENPAILNDDASNDAEIEQSINITGGDKLIYYSFEVSNGSTWEADVDIDGDTVNLFTGSTNAIERGAAVLLTSASGASDLTITFSNSLDAEITLNYIFICEYEGFIPENDWCFQLPLFSVGSELLGTTEFDLARDFTTTGAFQELEDNTGAACGAPVTSTLSFSPVLDGTLTGDGNYFTEIILGDVSITWALNPDDDTSKEVLLYSVDGAENSQIELTVLDANSSLLGLTSNEWNNGDVPELKVRAKEECDGTNERRVYNINVTSYSFIRAFQEETFTAEDDTFYNLSFKLNKCSGCVIEVYDSASTLIYNTSSNGVEFNKIFQTGSLPVDKTLTIRWEINDLINFPTTGYNEDVITEISVFKMCKWVTWVETDQEVFVKTFTETHDTTTESTGLTYHRNIEYCTDVNNLDEGCYQVRAIDDCDSDRFKISNQFSVINTNSNFSQISWTPNEVVCSGGEVIDYEAYPGTTYFWSKVDFQDLLIEREREVYVRSDGFYENPYTYQNNVEIMQIWSMPPFVREALAIGLSGVFKVNGVEYQTRNSDDIAPLFNAVYSSPIRIPVTKVGAFSVRRV